MEVCKKNLERLKNKFCNYVVFYTKHLINPISNFILLLTPFVVMATYQARRGNTKTSDIVVFILSMFFVSAALKLISYLINCGKDFPIPYKRFTNDSPDDGVTVKSEDLQEMILYMNDVENFLEREGLM